MSAPGQGAGCRAGKAWQQQVQAAAYTALTVRRQDAGTLLVLFLFSPGTQPVEGVLPTFMVGASALS